MNANKFTSRYLPFDLFCAECEKLGERYVSRRDKGSALIPVGYFARRVENYYRLTKCGNSRVHRNEYERAFLDNYDVTASALDSLKEECDGLRGCKCVGYTPTIFLLMAFAAENNRGKIDERIIKSAVKSYQKFVPFGIKELCSLKSACRYGLLKYIVNMLLLAEETDKTYLKAREDAASERFSLRHIKRSEYVSGILSAANENFACQIEKLLLDNGINADEMKNLFAYKCADLASGIREAAGSLRLIDDILTDEFILSLSVCDEYLVETGDANYIASDTATKLYFLDLISDGCGSESETAYISRQKAEYGDEAFTVMMKRRNKKAKIFYTAANVALAVIEAIAFSLWNAPMLLALLPLVFAQASLLRRAMSGFVKPLRPPSAQADEKDAKTTLIVMCCLIADKGQAERNIDRLLTVKYANPGFDCCLLCDFMPSENGYFSLQEEGLAEFMERRAKREGIALAVRKRVKNAQSGLYEGYEKKRGALLELCEYFLEGKDNFRKKVNLARGYEAVITLDEDSFTSDASRLCAVMNHPLNRGYAVAALCGKPYLASRYKNTFTALFGCGGGIDAYGECSVKFERDVLMCANYTGKGYFRVREFYERVGAEVRDNTVLSHDYIEGAFAGTLVTDCAVLEDFPDGYGKYEARRLRWLRGDVQLLPYLAPKITKKDGSRAANPLNLTQKRHIAVNIAAAFVPLSLLACVIRAAIFPHAALIAAICLCVFHPAAEMLTQLKDRPSEFMLSILRSLIGLSLLAYRAVADVYTALLGVARLLKRKNLMQWQTFSHSKGSKIYVVLSLIAAVISVGVFIITLKTGFLVCAVIFACALLVPGMTPSCREKEKKQLGADFIKNTLKDTWRYFSDRLEKGEALISDNCRIKTDADYARRTSPTNIGFSLVAILCAYINNFIGRDTFDEYVLRVLKRVEQLEKWHGHLFNWYDTESGETLYPGYVSTVDSGNFLVCCTFVYEYADADCRAIIDRLVSQADFMSLFDSRRQLLKVGYNSRENVFDAACYDLMASEALMTYIFCVGYGKIPAKSLACLKKRFSAKKRCLYSWTGGAFEYLMPWLFVSFPRGSVAAITAKNIVALQKKTVSEGIWGVSESQYRSVDDSGNYRYKAFGIADIAYSENAETGPVAAYASILCMDFDRKAVLKNLSALCGKNMYGRFGFYEAYDDGPLQSFMAHHQGMIMLALTNSLKGVLKKRYDKNPRIKSALLQTEFLPCRESFPLRKKITAEGGKSIERRVLYFEKMPPELNLMSDGRYFSAVNSAGGGWARSYGNAVYSDKMLSEGFTVKICADNCGTQLKKVVFEAERSTFYGRTGEVFYEVECAVADGYCGEMRRFRLENRGAARNVSLTVAIDFILAPKQDYRAHPEFMRLFISGKNREGIFICKNVSTGFMCGVSCGGFVPEFGLDGSFLNAKTEFVLPENARKSGSVGIICGYSEEEIMRKCRLLKDESYVEMLFGRYLPDGGINKRACCSLARRLLYGSFGCNVELRKAGYAYSMPVAVISVRGVTDIYGAEDKLRGYALLYKFGVEFDIVVSIGEEYGYYNQLEKRVRAAISASGIEECKPAGCRIDVVPRSTGDKILRIASEFSAESYANAENDTVFYRKVKPHEYVPLKKPSVRLSAGSGYFSDDGSFVCGEARVPFSNIIAAPEGGMLVTDRGGGFTFGCNAREKKITAFDNESRLDSPSEALFFEEKGNLWSALDRSEKGDFYCAHGRGYTEYARSYNGCTVKTTVFLSRTGSKFYAVSVKNDVNEHRKINVCYALAPVLGDFFDSNGCSISINKTNDGVFELKNHKNGMKAFLKFEGICFEKINASVDLINKMLKKPIKLPCFSTMCDIVPGGNAEFSIQLGQHLSHAECKSELQYAKKFYGDLSMLRLDVEEGISQLLSFLPYQTYCSRFYGRTGYYQVGGAYGFRDQLQDCLTMLYIDPSAVRRHILNCAAHQFAAGDVMHWWHEPFFGVRTRIMDDRLYLPYTVAEYIDFTGECEILAERRAFLKNVPVPKGSESFCGDMSPSEDIGSLLEHCKRAIFSVCGQIASDGLVYMHGGDWNDAMNLVGAEGRGRSVWLSMFLYEVINKFLRFVTLPSEKKYLFEKLIELKGGVAAYFNGSYFARAVTDDGKVIGTPGSEECAIDLLTQAYAAISGITSPERAEKALKAAWEALVDKKAGIIKLFSPPFVKSEKIGYITNYPPGVRENGGQYTHAAVWFAVALYKTGEKDKAYEVLRMLNPVEHCVTPAKARRYRAEPYVLSADVYSGEKEGRAGWSWYTGSASWYYVTAVRYMFGITIKNGVVSFEPALPSHIKSACVKIRSGKSVLTAEIDNTETAGEWHIFYGGVEYNTRSLDLKALKGDRTIKVKRCRCS